MMETALLGPWVRRYLLEHLINERNFSINTRNSYRDMLTLLLRFTSKHVKKSVDRLLVSDLSPGLVRDFLNYLETDRHCSPTTRNQRLGGLHAMARFIGENSPEHVQWCTQIRLIPFKRSTQPGITYLEKPELDALLNAPDCRTAQGHRDYTLLLFLYNSGARASEASNLRIMDIDWYANSVRIIGKGNKYRTCPLWWDTMKQLRLMIARREAESRVFLNRRDRPITRFGIHKMVKRHALKATEQAPSLSTKRISPHVIRHTTATHLLRAGVDINTIRAWLGHAALTTTNIYAETDLETKARALSACQLQESNPIKPWRDRPDLLEFLRRL